MMGVVIFRATFTIQWCEIRKRDPYSPFSRAYVCFRIHTRTKASMPINMIQILR
jgi:hypothetical protein